MLLIKKLSMSSGQEKKNSCVKNIKILQSFVFQIRKVFICSRLVFFVLCRSVPHVFTNCMFTLIALILLFCTLKAGKKRVLFFIFFLFSSYSFYFFKLILGGCVHRPGKKNTKCLVNFITHYKEKKTW